MKISIRLFGWALGFAALAVTGASAETAAMSIQLVSTFDYPGTGNQTRPQKINDNGDIAGVFLDSNGISHGFTRLANGTFSQIDDPNSPTPFTEGRGINNARTVCGDYTDSAGAFEGFFVSHNHFTNYDPETAFTIVLGINNAGDFSGSVIPSSGVQSAFVSIGGVMTDFVFNASATATLAYQINTSNTACGYYIDPAGATHGYYRDSSGGLHGPFDPSGSTGTIVFGNNDKNYIVGRYADAGGLTHGFLLIPPRSYIFYDFPGATFTSLNGINKTNRITGRYTDPSTGIDHGIIAQLVRSAGSPVLPLASGPAPVRVLPQNPADANPAY